MSKPSQSGATRTKRAARLKKGRDSETACRVWTNARKPSNEQLVLPLIAVLERKGGSARPSEIYDTLAQAVDLDPKIRNLSATDKNGNSHNLWERHVRFVRETAKTRGLITSPKRGIWELTAAGGGTLGMVKPGVVVTIFETSLGMAVWGLAEEAIGLLPDGSVDLLLTSPPYPLLTDKRGYGTMSPQSWLSWMADLAPEWRRVLKDTGSAIFNIGPTNVSGVPLQSPYMERFVLDMVDNGGLHLADRLYWENPTRMPPMEWVAVRRVRLRPSVEPLYWFSKSEHPKADNRNVLVPYKSKDRWIGKQKAANRPSGFDLSTKSFATDNGGRIPGTLITAGAGTSNDAYHRRCRALKLKKHPALMPEAVAEFCIKLTTDPGDFVVDPFFGGGTTGAVAEKLDRNWFGSERALAYLESATVRFGETPDISSGLVG